MTEGTARPISGLTPRSASPVSRLLKSERDVAPEPTAAHSSPRADEVEPAATAESATNRVSVPRQRPRPATGGRKPSITTYAPQELQDRARATFIHTRNDEGDESFSHLVQKAIEAEVRRREQLYNGGKPFAGGVGPLPSGRPIGQ